MISVKQGAKPQLIRESGGRNGQDEGDELFICEKAVTKKAVLYKAMR